MRDPAFHLETMPPNDPVPGICAVHALYSLGLDDEHARGWRKLEGREAGKVRALLANLEGEKPELIQTRLTEFAKRHKSIRERI